MAPVTAAPAHSNTQSSKATHAFTEDGIVRNASRSRFMDHAGSDTGISCRNPPATSFHDADYGGRKAPIRLSPMKAPADRDSLDADLRSTLHRMQEEHARAQAALREESRLLEILNLTGQSIASQLEIDKLLQTVTDAATELTGARFGAFFYNAVNERGEEYQLYTLSGAPRAAFAKLGHPRNTALFAPTFRGEGPVRSEDVTRDPRYGSLGPHHGMPQG